MKWIGHALVALQLIGIGITMYGYAVSTDPVRLFLLISGMGIAFGLITLNHNRPGNFSIHPVPRTAAKLITSGPYQYVRHPMYTSVFLVLLGLALAAANSWGWIGMVSGTLAVVGKSYLEETYLVDKYPDYKGYKQKTKRIIPFVW